VQKFERRLLKLQAQLAAVKLLIIDELGYVPHRPIRGFAPVG
jgi:DNA replication protein DnaC